MRFWNGKKLTALLLAGAAVCAASGCGSAGSRTLTVGVRADIVNFGYYNEVTGKYYGLEIDLAEELADRLGYQDVEFVTVEPSTRKELLLDGTVDCIAAAYSIAESREESLDFSAAYYTDETVLMVETSSLFTGISDLKGKTIGIVNGTNAGPLLAEKLYEAGIITDAVLENTDTETLYEGASVIKTETYAELSELLESGAVDAVCMDGCMAQAYLDDQRAFLDVSIAEQEYGVATVKDSELSGEVADAVQNMLEDGTVGRLIEKWKVGG